jgi:Flp pilus assembly pilin Flp
MKTHLRCLWKNDSGAETVEWVAIAGLVILVGTLAMNGGLGRTINSGLDAIQSVSQHNSSGDPPVAPSDSGDSGDAPSASGPDTSPFQP